jgi:hypothetical protein
MLGWIDQCGHVVSHQIVRRYFLDAGAGYDAAQAALRALKELGYIRALEPLSREITDYMPPGRKADVLHLTAKGRRMMGLPSASHLYHPSVDALLLALQWAEVALIRQREGWYLIPRSDSSAVRRAIGAKQLRQAGPTAGDSYAAQDAKWIRRYMDDETQATPFDVLVQRSTGDIRLVVSTVNYATLKRDVAILHWDKRWGPIPVEVIRSVGQSDGEVRTRIRSAFTIVRKHRKPTVRPHAAAMLPHFTSVSLTELLATRWETDRYDVLGLEHGVLDIPPVGQF